LISPRITKLVELAQAPENLFDLRSGLMSTNFFLRKRMPSSCRRYVAVDGDFEFGSCKHLHARHDPTNRRGLESCTVMDDREMLNMSQLHRFNEGPSHITFGRLGIKLDNLTHANALGKLRGQMAHVLHDTHVSGVYRPSAPYREEHVERGGLHVVRVYVHYAVGLTDVSGYGYGRALHGD